MKMIIPIALGTIGIIACGYVIYKHHSHKFEISDDFNDKEIQRVNTLSLEKVLEWVDRKLADTQNDNKKFVVNIMPNKATLEIFKDKLPVSKKDINSCYLIVIEEADSANMIERKLIISSEIADELSCLVNDKIFVIPVE
ncbi:MAG: hypothetical protein NC115_01430 [Bacteroidales bacterium]|nr:hypothetical protein [Bacteroidales bacterium]